MRSSFQRHRKSLILKQTTCLLFGIFLCMVPSLHADDGGKKLSFENCYELALSNSEHLQISREEIKAAEARYNEVLAAVYPNVHGVLSERLKESSKESANNNSTNNSGGSEFGNGSNNSKSLFQGYITVHQPIFSGFRDFLLSEAALSDIEAKRKDEKRAHELLYLDVAEVFEQIRLYEADLKILEATKSVLNQRITELEHFIKLGKSRESEILAARADIADLEVTRENVLRLLTVSKEMLSFLTTVPTATLEIAAQPIVTQFGVLDSYLENVKKRYDIQSALERAESARKQLTAAERERWPNVSLDGSFYPYQNPDTSSDWSVLLKLDVPLFDGGAIDSRVQQRQSNVRATELSAAEGLRIAERDVRIAYANVSASKSQVSRLAILVSTNQKNYESQHKDYELGVVTNLDVLQSIKQMQDAKRRLIEAESTERINKTRLEVATGGIL